MFAVCNVYWTRTPGVRNQDTKGVVDCGEAAAVVGGKGDALSARASLAKTNVPKQMTKVRARMVFGSLK
jgi:hypothetical protein